MTKRTVELHRVAGDALHTLGDRIRLGRHSRGWTAAELGTRIGVSARTVRAIEEGSPGAAVGSVFNAAVMVGVSLFTPDRTELARMRRRGEDVVALIPSRTHSPRAKGTPDDFAF